VTYLVGLTGGIGSGKSTVTEMLSSLGVRIVDTDLISHQLTQADGAAISALRSAFGEHFIDSRGALDRGKMRELVFSDLNAKQRLESILHPLILAQTRVQATSPSAAPYTLVVVPLLFENGRYTHWLQRVITVDCPEENQILRTMQRSKLDDTAVRNIMSQQLSRAERMQLADETLHNDGSLDALKIQVVEMHHRLIAFAAESD
jgi:dephospho-CoA kinase